MVKKKVKRSSETVGSGDEEGTPKKRRSNGNSAFNKELILRWVPFWGLLSTRSQRRLRKATVSSLHV